MNHFPYEDCKAREAHGADLFVAQRPGELRPISLPIDWLSPLRA
jgi:hypothetical protein